MATSGMARGPSQQAKQWLTFYFTTANRNASQAARLAGYAHPSVVGSRLLKRYREAIDAKEAEETAKLLMDAEQVRREMSAIAANSMETTANRLRALDSLARIHGLFNDKLTITADPKKLAKDLRGQLTGTEDEPEPAKQPLLLTS